MVQKINAINKKSCFSFFVGSSYIDLFSSSAMITQFTPMFTENIDFFIYPDHIAPFNFLWKIAELAKHMPE